MWKIAVLVLVGFALGLGFTEVLAGHISFHTITTGFIAKYHEQPAGTFKQDLSGAATDGKVIIFADDGGSFIRVVRGGLPDTQAVNVPLVLEHKDLEGATFRHGVFAIITSHSKAGSENQSFRRLTRFKLSEDKLKLQDEKSVDLRDPIMAALQKFGQGQFGNDDWFNRIKNADERAGGLNIEGLSTTGDDISDSLYVGIKGPLFGPCFANPMCPNKLRTGEAIIVKVKKPFGSEPSFEFTKLNLLTARGNHGIRGMELIPAMKGFVIIGGPAETGGARISACGFGMETPDWRGLLSQARSREISGIYSESFADLKQSFRWKRRGRSCWWYSANSPHLSVPTCLLLLLQLTPE